MTSTCNEEAVEVPEIDSFKAMPSQQSDKQHKQMDLLL